MRLLCAVCCTAWDCLVPLSPIRLRCPPFKRRCSLTSPPCPSHNYLEGVLNTIDEQLTAGSTLYLTGSKGMGKTHCALAWAHRSFLSRSLRADQKQTAGPKNCSKVQFVAPEKRTESGERAVGKLSEDTFEAAIQARFDPDLN